MEIRLKTFEFWNIQTRSHESGLPTAAKLKLLTQKQLETKAVLCIKETTSNFTAIVFHESSRWINKLTHNIADAESVSLISAWHLQVSALNETLPQRCMRSAPWKVKPNPSTLFSLVSIQKLGHVGQRRFYFEFKHVKQTLRALSVSVNHIYSSTCAFNVITLCWECRKLSEAMTLLDYCIFISFLSGSMSIIYSKLR